MTTTPEKIELTRQEANVIHGLVQSAKHERMKFCYKKNWSADHDQEYLWFQELEEKVAKLRDSIRGW